MVSDKRHALPRVYMPSLSARLHSVVQLVGLQCRAAGAQSRCTETRCVRSCVPGDRFNADPGSVGSSHSRWQVDCARLDEGVSLQ